MDLFGVAVSPFDLDEWQQATNLRPDLCMVFEAWSRQRSLAPTLAKAASFGHDAIVVTWEPWEPTEPGSDLSGEEQPEYNHDSILQGSHDDYIDMMARCFRDSGLSTIYLRYGHEMNGDWYPWHHHPDKYVAAWKYLRHRIRTERGAWNVKLMWSPNPDLWRPVAADWLQRLLPYWPGPAAVDHIGYTMIEFGGTKDYPVSLFAERFALTRQLFAKQVLATEVNVAREKVIAWLSDLSAYVCQPERPLPLVVLSQGESRAAAGGGTGDLGWSAATDPEGCAAVANLANALHLG